MTSPGRTSARRPVRPVGSRIRCALGTTTRVARWSSTGSSQAWDMPGRGVRAQARTQIPAGPARLRPCVVSSASAVWTETLRWPASHSWASTRAPAGPLWSEASRGGAGGCARSALSRTAAREPGSCEPRTSGILREAGIATFKRPSHSALVCNEFGDGLCVPVVDRGLVAPLVSESSITATRSRREYFRRASRI